jgi:hypothetical protein
MIVVKIELWSAVTHETSEIGRMYIANDGSTGTVDRGDYSVAVCRRGTDDVPRELIPDPEAPAAARVAAVKNYPRLAYNVWRLIARAVHAAFPEEAKRAKRDERTLLDEQVMRGLQRLADLANANDDVHDAEAVNAALAWLDAAKGDGQ